MKNKTCFFSYSMVYYLWKLFVPAVEIHPRLLKMVVEVPVIGCILFECKASNYEHV